MRALGRLGRIVRQGADEDYGPELGVLRTLGLFNRPADAGAVEELRKKPSIQGVTDKVAGLHEARWATALSRLSAGLSWPNPVSHA